MKPFLYDHLTRSLLVEVASGGHLEGGRFLSRRRIEATWDVSRPTVESALGRLIKAGILSVSGRRAPVLQTGAIRKACILLDQDRLEPRTTRSSWAARRACLTGDQRKKGLRLAIIVDCDPTLLEQIKSLVQSDKIEEEVFTYNTNRHLIGFIREANQRFCETDLLVYEDTEESARGILNSVRDRNISGVAVFRRKLFGTPFQPLFQRLRQASIPVISALNDCEGAADASVNYNDPAAGYTAMRVLVENGHSRILMIHGPVEKDHIEQRCHGAMDYLVENDLCQSVQVESFRVSHGEPGLDRKLIESLRLQRRNRPTAMLCPALHLFTVISPMLKRAGIRIPRDLSVINCGNRATVDPFYQSMDIIDLDLRKIGTMTARHLIQLIEGDTSERTVLIDAPYISRKTVLRRRTGAKLAFTREKLALRRAKETTT